MPMDETNTPPEPAAAPTPAASVGDARPPRIEPRTATMRITGAASECIIIAQNSRRDISFISSAGMAGAPDGFTITKPI